MMEENKVENVINIIKDMNIKNKLRLGICLTTSDWANILYNKTEMYEKFDTMLKEIDEEYRNSLMKKAETEEGLAKLYEEAKKIDPEAMEIISQNDKKRIIRVLEIYKATGKNKTEQEILS